MSQSRVDATSVMRGRRQGSISPGILITIILSCVGMLLMLGYILLAGGPQVFVFGLILALLPVPVLLALVFLLDLLKPQPIKLLAVAFFWGAGVGTAFSLVFNTIGGGFAAMFAANRMTAEFLGTAVVAPVVEESFKGAVLLGFLFFRRRRLTSLTDGIILGAMVGLGFAWVENVLYYAKFFDQVLDVFVLRGIITPLLHPLFTLMTGLAVAAVAMMRSGARFLLLPVGWALAVLLHAAWNGSGFLRGPGQPSELELLTGIAWTTQLVYVLDFFAILAVILVVIMERRRIVAAVARYLPPYISTGLVTEADITMLSSMGARGQARQWAASVAGQSGRKAMSGFQLTAIELAALSRQVERGWPDKGWWLLRDAYLMHMDQCRQTFIRQAPKPPTPAWTGSLNDTGFLSREALNIPKAPVATGAPASHGAPYRQRGGPGGPPPPQPGPPPGGPYGGGPGGPGRGPGGPGPPGPHPGRPYAQPGHPNPPRPPQRPPYPPQQPPPRR